MNGTLEMAGLMAKKDWIMARWIARSIDVQLRVLLRNNPDKFAGSAAETLACGMPWRWLGYQNLVPYLVEVGVPEEVAKDYAANLQPLIDKAKARGDFQDGLPWEN